MREQYRDFIETTIWKDLQEFFSGCIELNRDLLEGIQSFRKDAKPEPMDAIRGRNWQIRDIVAYVNEMAGLGQTDRSTVEQTNEEE